MLKPSKKDTREGAIKVGGGGGGGGGREVG